MKKFVPVLIAALALAVAYIAWQTFRADASNWVAKAEYDKAVQSAAVLHEADLQTLAVADAVIAVQDKTIAELKAAAGKPSPAEQEKDKTIAALAAKVSALEAQGDLAGALQAAKEETKAWAEKFSLAEKRHSDALTALDRAWQVKFDAQVSISQTWQTAYEREHGLRLSAEALIKTLEPKKWEKPLEWSIRIVFFIAGNISHR